MPRSSRSGKSCLEKSYGIPGGTARSTSGSSTYTPVLIVSENTWPHDGFSRNRSTRPSASTMTTPNSSGLSTDFSAMVAATPLDLCAEMSASRSKSQSASPEMTRNVSSSSSSAFLTLPAVPSGRSSTE